MHKVIFGALLAAFVGTAAAGPLDWADRPYDSTAYSATAYYQYSFGAPAAHPHQLGLRFDARRSELDASPALLQTSFDGSGAATVKVRGLVLPGIPLASGQDGTPGFFASMSATEWVAVGFTAVVLGATVSSSAKGGNETTVNSSGGG